MSEPLASLNQCLTEIGETPVSKLKLQQSEQTKYSKQKVKKITTAKNRVMICGDETDDNGGEIVRICTLSFLSVVV